MPVYRSSRSANLRTLVLLLLVLCVALSCSAPGGFGSEDGGGTGVDGPRLRSVDGGADYYGRFVDGLPTSPDFIPVGVWAESVVDETTWQEDKSIGLNLYVAPTPNTDLSIIRRAGMYALPTVPDGEALPMTDLAGFSTVDEADMWAGPGDAAWTGNYPGEGDFCEPSSAKCGYTVLETLTAPIPEGRMTYTNYGKGVAFWETDVQARRFVNDYQDVVSADIYWFTDPNVCGPSEAGAFFGTGETVPDQTCRRASNYGATVARVRRLVEPAGSRPVWNFVEVGQPFSDGSGAIALPEIRAAVWSGFINGARGVVYFNHSFAGDCQSQHVLRDCDPAIASAVTVINAQIARLAPVLNAPSIENFATFGEGIDGTAKFVDGQFYLILGSKSPGSQTADIKLHCGGAQTAEVIDENRKIPIVSGAFSDTFADGNAVHIYRLTGGDNCALG